MTGRDRAPEDHGAQTLPTRTVTVARGRVTWTVEMGSGRASQVLLTLPDAEEWRRIMEAVPNKRKAVRV
jgi:hypothetical protein